MSRTVDMGDVTLREFRSGFYTSRAALATPSGGH
jgi:hypothetical protein